MCETKSTFKVITFHINIYLKLTLVTCLSLTRVFSCDSFARNCSIKCNKIEKEQIKHIFSTYLLLPIFNLQQFIIICRNSSTESDNEEVLYSLRSTEDVILREEARESETECDRLCEYIPYKIKYLISNGQTFLLLFVYTHPYAYSLSV